MLEIESGLAAQLASGSTTLSRCWLLERRDGARFGFTDHDRAISFDGIEFEPQTGLSRTDLERSSGLAVDNLEVLGALRSGAIEEHELARGLFDGALIRQWLVDWSAPARRVMTFAGRVGEVRRGARSFEAEIEGMAELLNRPMGRVFLRGCDASLGDARCGVALEGGFTGAGVVTSMRGERSFAVSGLSANPGWFALGRIQWSGGENAGAASGVQGHSLVGGVHVLTLWRTPSAPIQTGDAFDIVAGCDKTAGTCREKFQNIDNFRGFPHLPGEDWATGYPGADEVHDGGSLFGDG